METALRTRLKGNTSAGNHVDWGVRPQASDLPAIRLNIISSPRGYTMAGAQATQQYLVQADCYGATYKAAKELGDEVVALLEPASGSFQASFLQAHRDSQEKIETAVMFNRSLDLKITYISA